MIFRVEFTDAATVQAETAATWWRSNRSAAPALFDDELAYALDLLSRMPPPTQVWGEIEGKAVRKVRLPRTGHALYFESYRAGFFSWAVQPASSTGLLDRLDRLQRRSKSLLRRAELVGLLQVQPELGRRVERARET